MYQLETLTWLTTLDLILLVEALLLHSPECILAEVDTKLPEKNMSRQRHYGKINT